jgi:hypothetical protein
LKSKIASAHNVYSQLIKKAQFDLEQPKNLIDLLEEKLLIIYNLLFVWKNYISIMKMSFEKVREMQNAPLSEGIEDADEKSSDDKRLKEVIEAKKKEYQIGNDRDTSVENFFDQIHQEMKDAAQYNSITKNAKSSDTFVEELGKQAFEQIQKEFELLREKVNSIYGTNATVSPKSSTGDNFFGIEMNSNSQNTAEFTQESLFNFFGMTFKTVV